MGKGFCSQIRKNNIMTKKKSVGKSKGKISDKVKSKVAPKKKINDPARSIRSRSRRTKQSTCLKVCHKVCPKKAVGYFSPPPQEVSLVGKILRFLGLSK